jgi:hypothetical protein
MLLHCNFQVRFPIPLPGRFKALILSPGPIRFKTMFLYALIYSLLEFTYQICLLAVRARSHYTFWKFSSLKRQNTLNAKLILVWDEA